MADTKLSPSTKATIRQRWRSGHYTQQQLADIYGVSQPLISRIVRQ